MSGVAERVAPTVATRWWLVGGTVLLALTLGWGTLNVVELLARDQRTEVVTFDESITTVDIDTDNGSLRVVATGGTETVLTTRISEGLRAPRVDHEVIDGRLVARSRCPMFISQWCSVSYVLEVPDGTIVDVRTRHGDVRVMGPVGTITASSRHGDIEIDGSSDAIEATSQHGDVTIQLSSEPSSVRAETRHGDVELVLPDGVDPYAVELRTRHGDTVNAIRSDPTSERVIALSTRHGDVVARYGP